MNEYNVGDLVEASKGDTIIRGRVSGNGNIAWPEFSGVSAHALAGDGFTITVIEKAAPPCVTEPGYYFDKDGDPIRLDKDDAPLYRFAPYTRLEPVPTTAARIALSLENNGQTIAADNVRNWYGK